MTDKPAPAFGKPGASSARLDSPSTAGCENWPLQPAAQGGEPVEPRLLSASGGFAGMTIRCKRAGYEKENTNFVHLIG